MKKCEKCSFTVEMPKPMYYGDRLMTEARALALHVAVVHGDKK